MAANSDSGHMESRDDKRRVFVPGGTLLSKP